MNTAYLLIGGNLGDRVKNLSNAVETIRQKCGIVIKTSALYETEAWGLENQSSFLNQAIELQSTLSAESLLHSLLAIEEGMGRIRNEKYGPRIIDIDIIFYNDAIINTQGLQLPHPQMQKRLFVLEPLNEIAPDKLHPVLQKTVHQLLLECTDTLKVNKFT